LNRNWQPVTFLPVGVAITTVMRDMGSVLDPVNYVLMDMEEWIASAPPSDRMIKTASTPVPAPEVIVLKQYGERPPRGIKFSRPNLYRRDESTCQYCGDQLPHRKLTIEHILPRSRGGGTSWENCVAACSSCNSRKADKTPREAGMRLRSKPAAPRWSPGIPAPRGTVLASWEPFLAKERVA
jgi:5-methylcytosine-specific restriction endonuclease McrA